MRFGPVLTRLCAYRWIPGTASHALVKAPIPVRPNEPGAAEPAASFEKVLVGGGGGRSGTAAGVEGLVADSSHGNTALTLDGSGF